MLALTLNYDEPFMIGDAVVVVHESAGKFRIAIDGRARVLRPKIIEQELRDRGYELSDEDTWLKADRVYTTVEALRKEGLTCERSSST